MVIESQKVKTYTFETNSYEVKNRFHLQQVFNIEQQKAFYLH